jgi:hypothetical protein
MIGEIGVRSAPRPGFSPVFFAVWQALGDLGLGDLGAVFGRTLRDEQDGGQPA